MDDSIVLLVGWATIIFWGAYVAFMLIAGLVHQLRGRDGDLD